MKKIIITLAAFVFIIGCGRSADKMVEFSVADEASVESEILPPPGRSPMMEEPQDIQIERKIIKECWIRFEVEKFTEAVTEIKSLVEKHDGYINQENESSSDYSLNNNMTIRVPAGQFDILIDELTSIAIKVDNKNINARDVTEEYIDIEARLNTKREVEKRYLALLNEARTIPDILAVEEKLRIIREEIESKEGRLKYLNNQVSLSTIHLEVYQKLTFEPGFKFFKKIGSALKGGWKGLLKVLVGLVYIWPVLIILAGILFWLVRRSRRRNKK